MLKPLSKTYNRLQVCRNGLFISIPFCSRVAIYIPVEFDYAWC